MNCCGGSSNNKENVNEQNVFLLDYKQGDVTGDGILDNVYLYGHKPDGAAGIFADNITLVIQDGRSNQTKAVTPRYNAGYNARLFLADFDKDKTDDIKISIDSGGSGGYGIYYIYSYKNYVLQELFNFETYNNFYRYRVDYNNYYKVDVGNAEINKLFILDISYKGPEYLSQYYNQNGKLINPVKGEVLALGVLIPIVNNEKDNYYDLLAIQRIIGTSNADTLGYVENILSWDGQRFTSINILVSIPGTNLISLY